jgi:hypothetical protein
VALIGWWIVAGGPSWLHAQTFTPQQHARLAEQFAGMELLMCFQGKGSCLPYDAGVLDEAYRRIPALRNRHAIVAGNSSGSIPAAFFGCFGFSDRNVEYAIERLTRGDRTAVRNMENVNNKISRIARGLPTEISHSDLREYIAFALGVTHWQDATTIEEIVRRSSAKPQFPCLIVACNKEVLEDRHPESQLSPGQRKEIDLRNFQVSWKPEVYEYYRQHPDRFRREQPELIFGPDRRIGSAVTYFVDQSMYDLLSQIPAEERTADLRLMTTAADVALAILASASEPSYFPVVADPEPHKILSSGPRSLVESARRRLYNGGYIISIPAQDVRRMLPGIRVLGTGWRHNPLVARILLKNWLLADCDEIAYRSEWWADMEVNPDAEFESHIEFRDLSGEQEFLFGKRRARELFDRNLGLPTFVKLPEFHHAAAAAIAPNFESEDMFEPSRQAESATVPNKRRLQTLRGLGPLLQPDPVQPQAH